MTDTNTATAPQGADKHGRKRTLVGKVTSAKMTKTVVVEVVRSVRHPIYGKYVRRREKYKTGDVVEIHEHRPLSREKRWAVVKLVSRPEET